MRSLIEVIVCLLKLTRLLLMWPSGDFRKSWTDTVCVVVLFLQRLRRTDGGGPSLLSILYLRDSCEMKVLIIHGVICIYLNCRNGDKHPLFSTPEIFMRFIIIKCDCVGGRVDTGGLM